MSAVDQHRQLHRTRPAEVPQRVKCRAHGTAGEQHVVDQHHQSAIDATLGNGGAFERAVWFVAQVVAVQRDVQESRGHLDTGEFGDVCGEPLGEGGSAGRDADQDDAGRVTGVRKRGLFDDLMRDTRDGPADICGGQQFASFNRMSPTLRLRVR
ncbi:Uncharacterised protein [Mycobacteroides abscessus subsp. abscessus]|nr:Uncharacterised protein [Mycobacteroides abscessus subsp. abscessus]